MKFGVIIPTKDRREDLFECLMSMRSQSVLPEIVVIVDSSKDNGTEEMIKEIKHSYPVQLVYIRYKKPPSSTGQRNVGIKYIMDKVDLIHFLDDDVVFVQDDYFAKINIHFLNDSSIGGGAGQIVQIRHVGYRNKFGVLFRKVFLLTEEGVGKLKPSGWASVPSAEFLKEFTYVEVLPGVAVYRSEVFEHFLFDENLTGPGTREDMDFSYRVSRKYKLFFEPMAKILHKATPSGRPKNWLEVYAFYYTHNHFYLFRKLLPQDLVHIISFIWSDIGSFLGFMALSFRFRNILPILGALKAYRALLTNGVQRK